MSSTTPKTKKSSKSKQKSPPPSSKKSEKKVQELSKETVSESESESDEEMNDAGEAQSAQKSNTTTHDGADYHPPETFTKLSNGSLPDTNPFSAKNLEGKELWFIAAPASAPMTKLSVINSADIADGKPVLATKNGRNFVLKAEENEEDLAGLNVLVPNKEGKYTGAIRRITKSFTLAETVGHVRQLTEDDIPTKPIKAQPEGLRQRFKPIGAENDQPDSVDDTMGPKEDLMEIDDAPPAGAEKEERKKKRHKSSGEDGEKKKKKKKKTAEA